MRMLQIGGPLHGTFAYVTEPPLPRFKHRTASGSADLWRRFKPGPGEPTRYQFVYEVFYRVVLIPEGFVFGIGYQPDVSRVKAYGLSGMSEAAVLKYLAGGMP